MNSLDLQPARMPAGIESPFDYDGLAPDIAREMQSAAEKIRRYMRDGVIEVGRELLKAKDRVQHGDFRRWLEAECHISMRTLQPKADPRAPILTAWTKLDHADQAAAALRAFWNTLTDAQKNAFRQWSSVAAATDGIREDQITTPVAALAAIEAVSSTDAQAAAETVFSADGPTAAMTAKLRREMTEDALEAEFEALSVEQRAVDLDWLMRRVPQHEFPAEEISLFLSRYLAATSDEQKEFRANRAAEPIAKAA
jgi:hypothetical protein